MACNNIVRSSVGADYAHEHSDQGIRMGESPVMLSAAKHLPAQRDRPVWITHTVTQRESDIVPHRLPFFGLWWRSQASMPGYDVLALSRV